MRKIITLICTIFIVTTNLQADWTNRDKLPKISKVDVHSVMTFDSSTGQYLYDYSLTNVVENVGDILSVSLDIKNSDGSTALSTNGLKLDNNEGGSIQYRFFQDVLSKYNRLLIKQRKNQLNLVPVGSSAPLNWVAGIGFDGYLDITSSDGYSLPPSQTIKFEVTSFGIPGIREMVIKPDYDPEGDFDRKDYLEYSEIVKQLPIHMETVGPVAPPENLDPASFIGSVEEMIKEAVKQGWVKNSDLTDELNQKLEAAKSAIESGSNAEAIKNLNELVTEVENQKGSGLTSEGYGLLKFNALFLADKLRQ